MAPRHSPGSVRVSFAAILRIKADDRYILLHTPNRPGTFSPPGGVFKYFSPAERLLEAMGFREDRIDTLAQDMTFDLRGYLPAVAVKDFRRWFAGGAYREDTAECLCREIAEELGESGLDDLIPCATGLAFTHVRTVHAGPDEVPGTPYRQLRRFDVCDLVVSDPAARRLRAELIRVAADQTVPTVISASAADIMHGRSGGALIAGHAAYLFGTERTRPDIPAIR
jgi:SMODS-associated NUDIX domain